MLKFLGQDVARHQLLRSFTFAEVQQRVITALQQLQLFDQAQVDDLKQVLCNSQCSLTMHVASIEHHISAALRFNNPPVRASILRDLGYASQMTRELKSRSGNSVFIASPSQFISVHVSCLNLSVVSSCLLLSVFCQLSCSCVVCFDFSVAFSVPFSLSRLIFRSSCTFVNLSPVSPSVAHLLFLFLFQLPSSDLSGQEMQELLGFDKREQRLQEAIRLLQWPRQDVRFSLTA